MQRARSECVATVSTLLESVACGLKNLLSHESGTKPKLLAWASGECPPGERSSHFSRLPPHFRNAETQKRAYDQACIKWDNAKTQTGISNRKERVNVEFYQSVQGASAGFMLYFATLTRTAGVSRRTTPIWHGASCRLATKRRSSAVLVRLNCPEHIGPRFIEAELAQALEPSAPHPEPGEIRCETLRTAGSSRSARRRRAPAEDDVRET